MHTKGPWRTEGWLNLVVNSRDGYTITVMPGASPYATLEEHQANSALIAAAPDLFEALGRLLMVASVELTGKRDDVLEQARAAIAKAQTTK